MFDVLVYLPMGCFSTRRRFDAHQNELIEHICVDDETQKKKKAAETALTNQTTYERFVRTTSIGVTNNGDRETYAISNLSR